MTVTPPRPPSGSTRRVDRRGTTAPVSDPPTRRVQPAHHPRGRSTPDAARGERGRSSSGSGGNRTPPRQASTRAAHLGVTRWRLAAIMFVVVAAAAGLTYRLVDLQLRHADQFVQIGLDQRFRTVLLAGDRGDVLDRNGNALATSVPSTSFFIDPQFVLDPVGDALRLAPVVQRPVAELQAVMGGEGRFAWLVRQTSEAQAAEILALDIAGVFATNEPDRFHPAGPTLARSVVGTVDIDGLGVSGIENIFNGSLQGQPGELSIEIGVNGATIPGVPDLHRPAVPGADVVLTIDRSLQFEVERVLFDQINEMGARGGVVMVSDPTTSEILAMASMTRNDDGEVISTSLNMATSWSFEPGSVMKAMTFASIIDAGIADSRSRSMVSDRYQVNDAIFQDSSPHPTTEMTVAEIMRVSSNVGTVRWAEQLGGAELDRYLRDFGFGSLPNLGFPGETAGLMIEPDIWGGLATATTALGQGISVTPAQLLAAYNTIANDGVYRPLQMVREIVRSDGTREVPPVADGRQVVSSDSARQVRAMLELAVAAGTGTNAQVEGYRVAGKTGTARKPLDSGQGYVDGAGNYRYVATFVGFLPADVPKLSIVVTIDQPTASIYASYAAAPAFAEIASYAVRHFGIAPPPPVAVHDGTAPAPVAPPVAAVDRVVGQTAAHPEPDPAPVTGDPTNPQGLLPAADTDGAPSSGQDAEPADPDEFALAEPPQSTASGG